MTISSKAAWQELFLSCWQTSQMVHFERPHTALFRLTWVSELPLLAHNEGRRVPPGYVGGVLPSFTPQWHLTHVLKERKVLPLLYNRHKLWVLVMAKGQHIEDPHSCQLLNRMMVNLRSNLFNLYSKNIWMLTHSNLAQASHPRL